MTSSSQEGSTVIHRLWISDQLFLKVDKDGYALGPCYEGALGSVLQLLSVQSIQDEEQARARGRTHRVDPAGWVALKVPRLMADTITENAYISAILDYEEDVVSRAGAGNALSGLVPSPPANRYLLKGIRNMANGYNPEARSQDKCILLVSFSKERFPRFCNVKYENDQFFIYPPSAKNEFSFLTPEVWKLIKDEAYDELTLRDYRISTSCELITKSRSQTETVRVRPLSRSVADLQSSTVWFTGLPSIAYNWAFGTLQEAITKRLHRDWSIQEHYDLLLSVLNGLQTLHTRKLLHGDIRPANIMAVNRSGKADSFVLGDYGSFSMNDQLLMMEGRSNGHTTMAGPGVSRHRTSIFYAPERRNSIERETADTAVIMSEEKKLEGENLNLDEIDKETAGVEYLVHFGWHRDLTNDNGTLKENVQIRIKQHWASMRDTEEDRSKNAGPANWSIQKGDRLRVRDYVFIVTDSAMIDGYVYFRCHGRYAKVLHERMAVHAQGEERIMGEKIFNIPHYVEIRQWSMATDIYGIGVLALYSLFSSGLALNQHKENESASLAKNAENMLSEMVNLFDSEQNFRHLWPDLERFRIYLEHYEQTCSGEELSNKQVPIPVDKSSDDKSGDGATSKSKSIFKDGCDIVSNILRTTKHIDFLLEKFDYNVAHFLLFMHFILASLHRQTSIGPDEVTFPSPSFEYRPMKPFCVDRCEGTEYFSDPSDNMEKTLDGPARRASERIKNLRIRFDQNKYTHFVCPKTQLPKYDPSSEFQVRLKKEELERQVQEIKVDIEEKSNRIKDLEKRIVDALEKATAKHRSETEKLHRDHHERVDKINKDYQAHIERTSKEHANALREFEKQLAGYQQQMDAMRREIEDKERNISVKNAEIRLRSDSLKKQEAERESQAKQISRLERELGTLNEKLAQIRSKLDSFDPTWIGNSQQLYNSIKSVLKA